MIAYLKEHENYVKKMLEKNLSRSELQSLLTHHNKQIQWMQHERLAHLIVMLFVCLFMLLSLGFAVMNTSIATIVLTAFLLVLSVAYIIHYYRLENGVQRCYLLSGEIKKRMEL
ncbi:MAG TPA: hypothetical protein PLW90_04910 [Smithellaceae bacterium]|jgi:hypothetical protein|nr:hypothetical protein [Syntrophaceae bacterium]OPZ52121.1 MAG: hypothetical protein BWY90_01251 [Deltaproteobacteria bacterium ADurb.BinA014]HNV64770.1 hypothetical protein [Smithellaceae bacterium]MBP8609003.1 hypothetical protein [Syntrophaceae bacterium]HOD30372.1 hypothetical protein [Smithellaceae bacterium]